MANEKRLIDANALKRKLGAVTLYTQGLRFGKTILGKILDSYQCAVFEEINNAPTVDAVEVVHGRWEERIVDHEIPYYTVVDCSLCGCSGERWHTYCPNCGAKMDGDGK